MVDVSAAKFGQLCTIRVERLVRREGRGEVHILETDPHDSYAVVTGDLEFGAVVLNEAKSRETGGSKTLDLQLAVALDLELHALLHLPRKRMTLSTRTAHRASETHLSAMTVLLPVGLVEAPLERVPVGLRDADSDLENLLSHETSLA